MIDNDHDIDISTYTQSSYTITKGCVLYIEGRGNCLERRKYSKYFFTQLKVIPDSTYNSFSLSYVTIQGHQFFPNGDSLQYFLSTSQKFNVRQLKRFMSGLFAFGFVSTRSPLPGYCGSESKYQPRQNILTAILRGRTEFCATHKLPNDKKQTWLYSAQVRLLQPAA